MNSTTLSSFGDLLKTLRKQNKVDQQELATRLGVHRNTISKWERGMCLPESKTMVLELAHQLHLDAHDTRLLLEASLTALSPYWHLPYQRNPFFTGREEVLQQVHEALHQQQSALLSQSSTVSGLGGIGKTQLAIEYAYRYANEYAAVFWVSAETTESLTASFLALAEVLDLPEQHEHEQQRVVGAVLRWLNSHSDWLLIFDNVEEIERVKGFLPSSRGGALLFTSRRQALGITAQALDLQQMSLEEGMRLLLHRARLLEPGAFLERLSSSERAVAQEIVRLMDGLPLALDQAGAYIEATQCSLENYLRLFQRASSHLLAEREAHADHPTSVTRTFTLVFERLEHDHPAAAELLTVCAFLAPEAIPEEVFLEGAAHLGSRLEALATDPLAFQRAIKALLSSSLLQRHADTHTLTIHRLVQVVLRENISSADRRTWVRRLAYAMNRVFPADKTLMHYWSSCEVLLPHALVCLAWRQQCDDPSSEDIELGLKVASYLSLRARFNEVEPLYLWALQTSEQLLGPDHLMVATALNGLAVLYKERGKYAQVEPLYQRALYIREKTLGSDHPEVANSLHNLAVLYREQGRYQQAEPLFQRARYIREQALGSEHPMVASILHHLAILYYDRGRYEQAKILYERALCIREQALGLDHPDAAYTLTCLGNIYQEQRDYEQAESLYKRALHLWERTLGPDHPLVAFPLCNLGRLYCRQDKYEQAEPLLQRSLQIREQALGSDHPHVAYSLNALGNLYCGQGKYRQADTLYQRTLAIRQEHLGQHHPEVAETLHDLARLHWAQQRVAEALALYQQALAIREQALGPDHPWTKETQAAYIQLLRESGSEEAAGMKQTSTMKTQGRN